VGIRKYFGLGVGGDPGAGGENKERKTKNSLKDKPKEM
jgi:hypothetical protein